MGVLHSTLQAEQNFPISIRSFFFFSPLNQWEKYTLKFTLKMGIKRQKKKNILAAITNCIKQQ